MIVQYLGFGLVVIICICVISTILNYIFGNSNDSYTDKKNKKLLDNMKKLKK